MEKIMNLLGLSISTQIIILIMLASITIVWWIYSKASKDISIKEKEEKHMLERLYDPAITLIKLKKGSRINKDDFQSKFSNLLVTSLTFVYSKETEAKLNLWISGEENTMDLLSVLEIDRKNINKRLRRFPVRKIFSWLGDGISIFLVLYIFFWTGALILSVGSYKIISTYGVKVFLVIVYSILGLELLILWILYKSVRKRK